MEIDIINNDGEINMIMQYEKPEEMFVIKFWEEKEAIRFCEKVLKRYDYRVTRYDYDIRERASQ